VTAKDVKQKLKSLASPEVAKSSVRFFKTGQGQYSEGDIFIGIKVPSLWERRIAIVSTQHFIRHNDFADTLAISHKLLKDDEDLIHKAAGWMLREVGKKAKAVLEAFLDQHGTVMPRTILRYAIEHFSPDQKRAYLQRKQSSCEGAADGL
jgi:hypothetical protein